LYSLKAIRENYV